ncbi:MAG: type II and III secretion system protein family protein [Burkholderiales bacterium]|nr:type II and III secretion system protein family protein [Burkholderiales bacterium]
MTSAKRLDRPARTLLRPIAIRAGVALVALATAIMPATAQTTVIPTNISVTSADAGQPRRIELGIGKSVIVDLPRDAKEVFVANPKVANAVVRSTRKIFIIGQADGQTNVVIMDAEGRQIANIDINIGRDLNLLRRTLKAAVPSSQINVVPVGDTIVLTGQVASAGDALQAMDIAKGFVSTSAVGGAAVAGQVVNSLTVKGKDQVMLRVTVAEIQRVILKQLGINTAGDWQIGKLTGSFGIDSPLTLQRQVISETVAAMSVGNRTNLTPNLTLRAAERAGVMRTLAEPTLTAISGESAKFTAGGDIPVPSGESCTTNIIGQQQCVISVTYRQIGVALNFTPIVQSEGRISLHVSTEVTDLDYENQLRAQASNAPAFKTRKMETTVELPSGASLMSAGLMQTQSGQVLNGFPGLMNVPILGTLFRSRDYERRETELLIIVTPYIVKANSSSALARPDDGYADSSDPQAVLLGRLNRIYGTSPAPAASAYRGRAGFVID